MDEDFEAELYEEAALDDQAAYEASALYLGDDYVPSEDDIEYDEDDYLAYEADAGRGYYDDWPDPNEY